MKTWLRRGPWTETLALSFLARPVCGMLRAVETAVATPSTHTNVLPRTLDLAPPGATLADPTASVFRVLSALAVVLVVFVGLLWLMRNWQNLLAKRGHAPRLIIEEARSIGNRSTLYLVSHRDRSILIASSPQGVHFLTDLSYAGPAPMAPTNEASVFEKALRDKTPHTP